MLAVKRHQHIQILYNTKTSGGIIPRMLRITGMLKTGMLKNQMGIKYSDTSTVIAVAKTIVVICVWPIYRYTMAYFQDFDMHTNNY